MEHKYFTASVATPFECGGIFIYYFNRNFTASLFAGERILKNICYHLSKLDAKIVAPLFRTWCIIKTFEKRQTYKHG